VYVQKKKNANVLVSNKPTPKITDLLAESEKAIRARDSQRAYDLSVRATEVEPQSIDAWLLRATLAPNLDERIACANRLSELAPGYQDRYNVAFFALKERLDKNPFLAYLEETDELYRVIDADRRVLSIPKKRAPAQPYPPEETKPSPLKPAYGWLRLAIIGLLLAGMGTVVFAPLAVLTAVRAQRSVVSRSERISSAVVMITASALFVIGVVFSVLFILHWLG
jgi:hypothetical protein